MLIFTSKLSNVVTLLLSLLLVFAAQLSCKEREDQKNIVPLKSDRWFLNQVGGREIRVDDQVLDVRIQYFMQQALSASGEENTTGEDNDVDIGTTKGLNALRKMFEGNWIEQTRVPPKMAWVRDISIPSRAGNNIPARVYRPKGNDGILPVLVYYHGGGWVFGSIEAIDRATKWIAAEANVVVISVGYRLAPEAPYPAAWDDAEDAFVWAKENAKQFGGDVSRICVGGDSAGGNLSIAVSSRRLRAGQTPPLCQLLYYPGVDNRDIPSMRADYLSARLFGVGFWLDYTFTELVLPMTYPNLDLSLPEISPLFAPKDEMSKLPPTIIVSAGFDPLRDSNRAYAAKLKELGVEVNYREVPTLIHGVINLTSVSPVAHRAAVDSARDLGSIAHRRNQK